MELQVDVMGSNRPDAYAVLAWIPNSSQISQLAGYGLTKSSQAILVSKGINKYFFQGAAPISNENVTLVLSVTGKGTDVIINTKVLDKLANNAVLFEQTFVDTAGTDVLG